MALNTFKCDSLTPLHFKGLNTRINDLQQNDGGSLIFVGSKSAEMVPRDCDEAN